MNVAGHGRVGMGSIVGNVGELDAISAPVILHDNDLDGIKHVQTMLKSVIIIMSKPHSVLEPRTVLECKGSFGVLRGSSDQC